MDEGVEVWVEGVFGRFLVIFFRTFLYVFFVYLKRAMKIILSPKY